MNIAHRATEMTGGKRLKGDQGGNPPKRINLEQDTEQDPESDTANVLRLTDELNAAADPDYIPSSSLDTASFSESERRETPANFYNNLNNPTPGPSTAPDNPSYTDQICDIFHSLQTGASTAVDLDTIDIQDLHLQWAINGLHQGNY